MSCAGVEAGKGGEAEMISYRGVKCSVNKPLHAVDPIKAEAHGQPCVCAHVCLHFFYFGGSSFYLILSYLILFPFFQLYCCCNYANFPDAGL